ncbi:MAG: hypothetical protein RBR15_15550 [Sphaerochaeta sp.]|nr:hypothetical protein [Sphaerochaeta sp.]
MNDYKELKRICALFDEGFSAIEEFVSEWGHSKKEITAVMDKVYSLYSTDNILTDYPIATAYLYLLSEFFQNPKAIGLVKSKHEDELEPEGLEVLSYWEENPGFWCYFSVKEHLNGNFILIEDQLTGKEHILQSGSVRSFFGKNDAKDLRFLCLMLPNELCLQTVGAIKSYRIPVSDFRFYLSLFKPQKGLKAILREHYATFFKLDDIANFPAIMHQIYTMGFSWQPFKLQDFERAKLGGTWKLDTLDTFQRFSLDKVDSSMDNLPNRKLFDTTKPIMAGSILRDTTTGEMALFNNTEAAYTFFSAILNRAYPDLKLPKKASVFISPALQSLLADMDLPISWKKFEPMIEHESEPVMMGTPSQMMEIAKQKKQARDKNKKETRGKDTEQDQTEEQEDSADEGWKNTERALLDLFIEATETRQPLDTDAVCKATGLERDVVDNILHMFDEGSARSSYGRFFAGDDDEDSFDDMSGISAYRRFFDDDDDDDFLEDDDEVDELFNQVATFEVADADKEFELTGIEIPGDEFKEFIYLGLTDSEFFGFDVSEGIEKEYIQLANKTYAKEIEKYGVLGSIENLFFKNFDGLVAYPLMNTFFWILYEKGVEWVPVRSYAIEMLKWIPSDIVPNFSDQMDYIETFSKFVKKVLCNRSLCSLEGRPTSDEVEDGLYAIKATEMFYSLFGSSEE